MLHGGTSGTEYGDLAAPLEAFQHAKGLIQLAQGLQRYLDVPAIAVVLSHAQYGQDHVSIQRQISGIGGNLLNMLFDLAGQVEAITLEVSG